MLNSKQIVDNRNSLTSFIFVNKLISTETYFLKHVRIISPINKLRTKVSIKS